MVADLDHLLLRNGKYIFNNCSFVSNRDGTVTLLVNHINSEVEIRDSVLSNDQQYQCKLQKTLKLNPTK
jgi:ssDNA-specific exonuclease RecJ